MDLIEYMELNPIELLGYSKNNLIELMQTDPDIPKEYQDKLNQAIKLLNETQIYYFEN